MPPVDEIPFVGCYHNDEEMKTADEDENCIENPTAAQALVQTAAYRIDMDPSRLRILLLAMKKELVTETWQLDFMDFPSWRAMGFPVGLIASIRAVREEEEEGSKNTRNSKNKSLRSEDTSEYSSELLVESKAALHDARDVNKADEEHDKDDPPKRRISDITMSERFSFRTMENLVLPPPSKPKFDNLSPTSAREANLNHPFPTDNPPIAAHRRHSCRTSLEICPSDENQKQKRRSSLTMPLCPSRSSSITDLVFMAKEVGVTSDVECITLESIRKRKDENSNDDENLVHEKSMSTVLAGNNLDESWDAYLDDDNNPHLNDEHKDGEESVDHKKILDDDSSSMYNLVRRYTVR